MFGNSARAKTRDIETPGPDYPETNPEYPGLYPESPGPTAFFSTKNINSHGGKTSPPKLKPS